MLQFNDLNYYAVPHLPPDWSAPVWLRNQVGLFAGRLYLPFEELEYLRELLGLQNDVAINTQADLAVEIDELQMESSGSSDDNQTFVQDEGQAAQYSDHETKEARAAKLKTTRMLTFVHAWLGTRGRGQDFTHTPMGYICARKPLTADHPFFCALDNEAARSRVQHAMAGDDSAFADMNVAKDDDDHSDVDEEELDARHRLTEEELKLAEAAAKGAESENEGGDGDGEETEDDEEYESDDSESEGK